jgi:hypothetical protein
MSPAFDTGSEPVRGLGLIRTDNALPLTEASCAAHSGRYVPLSRVEIGELLVRDATFRPSG